MTTTIWEDFDDSSQELLQGMKRLDFLGISGTNTFRNQNNPPTIPRPSSSFPFTLFSTEELALKYDYKNMINNSDFKVFADSGAILDGIPLDEVTLYNNQFFKDFKDFTLVLFVSRNGVDLLRQYKEVTEAPNELVLFLEVNDQYNLFGSVMHVKVGTNLLGKKDLPFKDIFELTRQKSVNISERKIRMLIEKKMYGNKTSLFSWFVDVVSGVLDEVFSFFGDMVLDNVGDFFGETLAGKINGLKVGENRWNPDSDNGQYNPLFLPSGLVETLKQAGDNPKKQASVLKDILGPFDAKIKESVTFFKEYLETIKRFFPKIVYNKLKSALDSFYKQLDKVAAFLADSATGLQHLLLRDLQAANAYVCGLLNSIIDIVAGIFQVIGLLFKGLASLTDLVSNAAYYGALFAETIENGIEVIRKLDVLDFIKEAVRFQIMTAGKVYEFLLKTLSISREQLSYFYGYVIGIVIETVLEVFFTAGSATAARWGEKLAAFIGKSFGKLTAAIKQTLKFAQNQFYKILEFFNFLFNRLKKGARYLFDEFSKLLYEIFELEKKVPDELPKTAAEKRVLDKKELNERRKRLKTNRRERKKLDVERKKRNSSFWKDGYDPDPTFSIWGSGKLSHPKLWNQILEELRNKGCKVKFSEKNLVYGPHPSGGLPGEISITENCSITALMHEAQHFLDDLEKGFLGWEKTVYDPHIRWEMEFNAYMKEIKFLRENKEYETAQKLLDNALEEKRTIELDFNVKL